MFRPTVSLMLLSALTLTACGKSPTQAGTASRSLADTTASTPASTAPVDLSGIDPRVRAVLHLTQLLRDKSNTADSMINFHYTKADGTKTWINSHYKYMKPKHNFVELITGSDPKTAGTQLVWTGSTDVQVKTKFIGFWMNVTLPLTDDRILDSAGYRIDQTSIDKVFDTVLCMQNKVTYRGTSTVNGKPVTILDMVSPLSLKGATRETFGIETATGVPLLREMYKGDQLFYKMEVQSTKLNPVLSSADFKLK